MGKITGKVVYDVLTAVVPLYVSMLAAYGSVRWWKILTPEQCSGINKYVSVWAIPFLLFKFISESNPYTMNFKFLGADALQKIVALTAVLIGQRFSRRPDAFDWAITLYSLATFPNTLIIGVPLFDAFYGDYAGQLMVQIVFTQCVIWYTSLLILFEFRAAMLLISKQFPQTAERIASIKVDADVVSLSEKELDSVSEVDVKGKMHVSFRRTGSDRSRLSDFNGVEIYSLNSSRMGSFRERTTSSFDGGSNRVIVNMSPTSADPPAKLIITSDNNFASEKRGYHDGQFWAEEASLSSGSFTYGPHFQQSKEGGKGGLLEEAGMENQQAIKMPSQIVMVKVAITMAWRKLSKNYSIYACLIALVWALIANNNKIHITMPAILKGSYKIISDGGIGMTMFALGIFMGLQEKLIPCGKKVAALGMFTRFVVSPAIVALTSLPFGLRGDLLRITVLQAALPQAILPFVYAKQYNVHPEVQSTAVNFGMLIALPIAFVYFVLLGL